MQRIYKGSWEEISQLYAEQLTGHKVKLIVLDESEEEEGKEEDKDALFQRIMEISDQVSRLPVLDNRTPDEILGYNEQGLPEG